MPQTTLKPQVFDFGAPAVEAEVLRFRVARGGQVALRFENPEGVADGEVTVQTAPDASTWVDTAAADNLVAIANEAIPQKQARDFTINLRQDEDAYMRVLAVGGCRLQMLVTADPTLEIELM